MSMEQIGVFDHKTNQYIGVNFKKNADGSYIPAGGDAGPSQATTQTCTESADMTTAAAITPAPEAGKKLTAMDILVSTDTAMSFTVQMETSNNVLTKVYLPGPGSAQITLRGFLRADTADKKMMGKASVAGNVAITAVTFSEA